MGERNSMGSMILHFTAKQFLYVIVNRCSSSVLLVLVSRGHVTQCVMFSEANELPSVVHAEAAPTGAESTLRSLLLWMTLIYQIFVCPTIYAQIPDRVVMPTQPQIDWEALLPHFDSINAAQLRERADNENNTITAESRSLARERTVRMLGDFANSSLAMAEEIERREGFDTRLDTDSITSDSFEIKLTDAEDVANFLYEVFEKKKTKIVFRRRLTKLLPKGHIESHFKVEDTLRSTTDRPKGEAFAGLPVSGNHTLYILYITKRPILDDESAAAYLATFNAPDAASRRLDKEGHLNERATKIMSDRLGLTKRQVYYMLPHVQISIQGKHTCKMQNRYGGGGRPQGGRQMPHMEEYDHPQNCEHAKYRRYDGGCNNLQRMTWGKSHSSYHRFMMPDYSDGVSAPRLRKDHALLPNPRIISLILHRPGRYYMVPYTHMLMQWGQFISHDLTSKPDTRGPGGSKIHCCNVSMQFRHPDCYPISVPHDDPFYSRFGLQCMQFVRSGTTPHGCNLEEEKKRCELNNSLAKFNSILGHREQVNQASSFIDASHIYGATKKDSYGLRAFRGGFLEISWLYGEFPPIGPYDKECRTPMCYKAGDKRVNQHPGMVAMHTIWLREHNRIARILGDINPHWNDDHIYQETRRIVGAMFQHLTYNEYLPVILGPEYMNVFGLRLQHEGYFKGYDPHINAGVASGFSAAAYRFGHSMVQPRFRRFTADHKEIPTAPPLWFEFFNLSSMAHEYGFDQVIYGLINQHPYQVDEIFSSQLRNHLFEKLGDGWGLDLVAINIQRGRDNGLPSYTAWKEYCGHGMVKNWDQLRGLIRDETLGKFVHLYGHVEDLELYPGGIAETPMFGAIMGPTFACIIAQQFRNLRYGDRYWYENGDQLQEIRKTSMARVLCNNVYTMKTIQLYPMQTPGPGNERVMCKSPHIPVMNLLAWKDQGGKYKK
uniref:Uncharacterized protein n=1 Tax=Strigamia maritima TaxID=126957 RepID=T1IV55_STRMM